MTSLSDPQKEAVRSWLGTGLQLPEIQNRLAAEFGLRLTYMELKLMVSELEVLPQDRERVAPVELAPAGAAKSAPPAPPSPSRGLPPAPPPAPTPASPPSGAPAAGKVTVSADQIARPGALASGQVRFSDGKQAVWFLDESGQLGLAGPERGYRPPAADVPEFQAALERELARMGF